MYYSKKIFFYFSFNFEVKYDEDILSANFKRFIHLDLFFTPPKQCIIIWEATARHLPISWSQPDCNAFTLIRTQSQTVGC